MTPEAFWSSAQAVAVIGALIAGLRQYTSSVRSEKFRNAKALSDDYFQNRGSHKSVNDAVQHLLHAEQDVTETLQRFSISPNDSDGAKCASFIDSFLAIDNYYDEAYDLFRRRVLDRDYYLSRMNLLIVLNAEILAPYYSLLRPYVASTNEASLTSLCREVAIYRARRVPAKGWHKPDEAATH